MNRNVHLFIFTDCPSREKSYFASEIEEFRNRTGVLFGYFLITFFFGALVNARTHRMNYPQEEGEEKKKLFNNL